jgi:hypothetical protein
MLFPACNARYVLCCLQLKITAYSFFSSLLIVRRLAWQQMAYLLVSVALATQLFAAPPSSVFEESEME